MKSPFWLGIVTFSALALFVAECNAGPRDGGRRQPSRSSSGGFNRNSPSPASRPDTSSFNRGTRELSARPDAGNRNRNDRNFAGQDKLSKTLEGRTFRRGSQDNRSPLTQDKLNDFLGLSSGDQDRQQQLSNKQENRDDRQTDRHSQVDQTKQNISQRSSDIYHNVSQQWANKPEPFTASWYSQHPNAWRYSHPHADAWAAASFGALTGWVAGVASTPVSYSYTDSNVYITGDEAEETSPEQQAQEAQQLSQTTTPANADEQWLPIGVYALVQGDETQSQMLMQISISKSGQISGSYYNILSDNSQPLSGSLDKETQQVAWTVAGNQKAVFQTDLNSLTQQETPVMVRYADGAAHQMTLVRLPENS